MEKKNNKGEKKVISRRTIAARNEIKKNIRNYGITLFIGFVLGMVYADTFFNYEAEIKPQANEKAEKVEIPKKEQNEVLEPLKHELKVLDNSSVKTYMDYKKITNKASKQYQYIYNSGNIEIKNGYLMNDDYFGVALGSYFGKIGDKFIFTLDTGNEIKAVKIEEKSDYHTNNGYIQKWDKSVIEFVIDPDMFNKAKNGYVYSGNFNNTKKFNGKIVKIEKIEE